MSNNYWQKLGCALLALTASAAAQAEPAPAPLELLAQMCTAMEKSSYTGTVVYLRNNRLDSIAIAKRQYNGVSQEKISALNGESREIIRNNGTLMCLTPHRQSLAFAQASNLPIGPQNVASIDKFYRVQLEGEARVAGRDSYVVLLKPKDNYRYGYRLWIGKRQHMMLKNDLLDAQLQPLEQLMFTSLKLSDNLPDSMFAGAKSEFTAPAPRAANAAGENLKFKWRIKRAPEGFKMISQQIAYDGAGQAGEHLFLSDGLSSVSVFVRPYQAGKVLDGATNMGAINAYGAVRDGYKIVAVGAVPLATVMLINQNVELSPQS